jgi:hypothetical protein
MVRTSAKARCQQPIGLIKLNGKENTMPQVGKKKYPYTKEGKAAAKKAAKKTGKKVKSKY